MSYRRLWSAHRGLACHAQSRIWHCFVRHVSSFWGPSHSQHLSVMYPSVTDHLDGEDFIANVHSHYGHKRLFSEPTSTCSTMYSQYSAAVEKPMNGTRTQLCRLCLWCMCESVRCWQCNAYALFRFLDWKEIISCKKGCDTYNLFECVFLIDFILIFLLSSLMADVC